MTRAETEILDNLHDLLDREKAAILSGDIEQVSRILDQKEALFEQLGSLAQPSSEQTHEIREKLVRNQELLTHSLEGIRSVSNRLAEVRKTQTTLETYDSNGRRTAHQLPVNHTLEKRA